MSGIVSFPQSFIKSVQRGTTVVASNTTVNVTISSVNTSKSFVNDLTNAANNGQANAYMQLTSSTNLSILNGFGYGPTFSWEVIEYV